jgi:hypothetical protein
MWRWISQGQKRSRNGKADLILYVIYNRKTREQMRALSRRLGKFLQLVGNLTHLHLKAKAFRQPTGA